MFQLLSIVSRCTILLSKFLQQFCPIRSKNLRQLTRGIIAAHRRFRKDLIDVIDEIRALIVVDLFRRIQLGLKTREGQMDVGTKKRVGLYLQ